MTPVSGSGGTLPGRAMPLLICFSHLRWNFVFQRPQHVLTRATRQFEVVYIEEPIEEPGAEPGWTVNQVKADAGTVTVATPRIPAGLPHAARISLLEVLVGRLLNGRTPDVAWFYTPMALEFARDIRAAVTVYDNMDELSLFHGADSRMLLLETELMARADVVFTGGHSLYEAKRHKHRNIHPVPSSVDTAHFQRRAVRAPEPAELKPIANTRVGFFGVIDERMDMALLDSVADLRPDLQFVMVGPTVKIDAGTRPDRANIHWLGGRDYADLPGMLHHWTCGFMPFALNDSTRFISPTKTPEFLAAGLPVVSTPIRDVVRPYGERGLVRIATTPAQFAEAIDLAIADAGAPAWRRAVAAQLAGTSWDRTWSFMLGRLAELADVELEVQYA